MDLLALGAAIAILVAIVALGLAVGAVPANVAARSRLELALSGGRLTIDAAAIDPLRTRKRLGFLQSVVSGDWLAKTKADLRLADSNLQATDFLAIRFGLCALLFAGPIVIPGGIPGFVLGVVAGVAGYKAPQFWLTYRKNQRKTKLEAQLPEALSMIANSLKAGFGLIQSMSLAAEQLEHPIATELGITVHETNVGSSAEEAFLALSERNQNYDLDIVVTAVLVQRTAGGNLSEILETVTHTMRERFRIRGEIQTLTAQQKLTGIVIALLPVGVGGMFLMFSPDYIMPLFTETLGRVMLGLAGLLEFIGILVIQRILDIEV
jgi:tight adherence protein B